MSPIPKGLGAVFAAARKKAQLSQSQLASMAGCNQSAISMFEHNQDAKLSEASILKIAEILEIDIPELQKAPSGQTQTIPVGMVELPFGFCPDCECPSNKPYLVGSRILFKPTLRNIGRFCVDCGEILETKCPNCGARLNEGACCAFCGAPYVVSTLPETVNLRKYIADRMSIV